MINPKPKLVYCNNNSNIILNNNFYILSEQVKSLDNSFKQMNYTIKCIKKNKWKRGLYNAKRKYY